jgi:hypothetical protein
MPAWLLWISLCGLAENLSGSFGHTAAAKRLFMPRSLQNNKNTGEHDDET